jgi:hypothetical protein
VLGGSLILGTHLWIRFFDFDKNLRLEGLFFSFSFFLVGKLKKPLISVFSKNIAESKEPPVSTRFFKKKKKSKEPEGLMKEPAVQGRFLDPVLWIFLEP